MGTLRTTQSSPLLVPGENGDEGIIYMDSTAVAPSPSRDYYRLQVSDKFIRFTRWQITHKSTPMIPTETKVGLDKYSKEHKLVSEVEGIFGKPIGRYIGGLSQGHMDTIIRLPLKPLALIMEYVGIKHLAGVAPVCKRFEEVTSGNTLWKKFYMTYATVKGLVPKDAEKQAKHYGWKTVFLVHRIQENVFPGKSMRFGLVQPSQEIGAGEGRAKEKMPKVMQRQIQQEQQKLTRAVLALQPKVRTTKSLDDYLREDGDETGTDDYETRAVGSRGLYYSNPPDTRGTQQDKGRQKK